MSVGAVQLETGEAGRYSVLIAAGLVIGADAFREPLGARQPLG
jgi:hypothetical protein